MLAIVLFRNSSLLIKSNCQVKILYDCFKNIPDNIYFNRENILYTSDNSVNEIVLQKKFIVKNKIIVFHKQRRKRMQKKYGHKMFNVWYYFI